MTTADTECLLCAMNVLRPQVYHPSLSAQQPSEILCNIIRPSAQRRPRKQRNLLNSNN